MIKPISVFLLAGLLCTASCRHDSDLTNVPTVHFSEVQAILSANCTMSGCHNGSSEFSLMDYESVINNGEVKPNNARESKLYRAITGRTEEMMPPTSNPSLTGKQIQQIFVWIEQGAHNN